MPSAASSRAVPPVETISTPRFASPRANSTSPRLSDTLRSARRIRTSPGATTPAAGCPTSAIRLHPHLPRIVRIDRHPTRSDQPYRPRQQPVLDLVETLLDRVDLPLAHSLDVAMVGKLERLLQDDRPAVHPLVQEVDRHAGHLHAVLERLR